ncbi:PAC2 family protein [Microlunatus speluncae]|uniref:PAC2 family protein n=1 Tax=Microlunatus speluncae TaxID=2594267 RepID=UPI0012662E9C|nr:PAC2 family protein [Microlunatus speluncae]
MPEPTPDSPVETVDLRDLNEPIAVIAFQGWNDAGNAASDTAHRLAGLTDAKLGYEIDGEDFYDFQVNRPQVQTGDNGARSLIWPATQVKAGRLSNGRDLVLVEGYEPNMRWRQFCSLVTSALDSAGVTRAYLLGALLADTPHTRPIPVSQTAGDPDTAERLGLEMSTYEGPTGIVGVLGDALSRTGTDVITFWAAVPHYVSAPPCPKATLALLSKLESALDVPLDHGDLAELARAWERGVDELAERDDEVAEYVRTLEQQRDETELPEASGEAIAAEFERYLRRRES